MRLGIGEDTVGTHLKKLFRKLSVHKMAAAIEKATDEGLSRAISFPRVGHKYSPPVALFERLVYGVLERLSSSDGIKGVVVS